MGQTMKIVIPTAGLATRMRPQTWSKPKPLVSVAGRTVLEHLLAMFDSVPDPQSVEYVIILGPGLGEMQIPPFIKEHYPDMKVSYAVQSVMKGQSHAIHLAGEHLTGPLLVCFSDTLLETDFSFLAEEKAEGIAWIKQVPDPRRFGAAEVDGDGLVTRLVEKPTSLENDRVVVGCYYFREGRHLFAAIEEQMRRDTSLKGEYFLTDAINIMLEHGLKMRTEPVEVWLDIGTIEAALDTNRYLLEHGGSRERKYGEQEKVRIIPPVFIHESARVTNSIIGPHASIGPECKIVDARIEDSILESGVTVEKAALKGSFIGRCSCVEGRSADDPPLKLNIGDTSSAIIK
jgi:glucose-1-phosphate thymidylyltransferase